PFARPSEGQGGGPEEQELDLAGAAREAAGDSVVAQHAATWSPAPRIPRPPAARLRVPDIVYVLGRLVALAACLVPLGAFAVHVFAPDLAAGIPGAPAYLGIPAGFWSLVLMALFLGLAGEAAKRRGGRGW
ncbi:MAG: hypothetical protein HY721_19320, partial [Planctomycetes bacterium]|nr:hypothetical protein [Planctomycetota bacterium]